jgi:hypothetical protein
MTFRAAGSKRVDDAAFRRVDTDRCADVDIHRIPADIECRRIEPVPLDRRIDSWTSRTPRERNVVGGGYRVRQAMASQRRGQTQRGSRRFLRCSDKTKVGRGSIHTPIEAPSERLDQAMVTHYFL